MKGSGKAGRSRKMPGSALPAAAFWFAAIMAFTTSPSMGQPLDLTPEAASKQLTGARSQEWVLKDVRTVMGSDTQCIQGELYRFAADKNLMIERCTDGKFKETQHRWNIETGVPDLILNVDNKPYRMRFLKKGTITEMRLRDTSDSKASETSDMIFRLSAD
jgi:hypothetical protein